MLTLQHESLKPPFNIIFADLSAKIEIMLCNIDVLASVHKTSNLHDMYKNQVTNQNLREDFFLTIVCLSSIKFIALSGNI